VSRLSLTILRVINQAFLKVHKNITLVLTCMLTDDCISNDHNSGMGSCISLSIGLKCPRAQLVVMIGGTTGGGGNDRDTSGSDNNGTTGGEIAKTGRDDRDTISNSDKGITGGQGSDDRGTTSGNRSL